MAALITVGIVLGVLLLAYLGVVVYYAGVTQNNAPKKPMFICDIHGPVSAYTLFEGAFDWETPEGAKRRGPVKVCPLCFENQIKKAKSSIKP